MLTQRFASLFNLPNGINFKFYEEDILKADLDVLLDGVDCVIHLAAITDAAGSFNQRDEIEKVNYDGTKRVAEACIKTDTKLLFPSTTSVYGSQSEQVAKNILSLPMYPELGEKEIHKVSNILKDYFS